MNAVQHHLRHAPVRELSDEQLHTARRLGHVDAKLYLSERRRRLRERMQGRKAVVV